MKRESFLLMNVDKPSEITRFWKVGRRSMARPDDGKYRVNCFRDPHSRQISNGIFHKFGCEIVCFDDEVNSELETEAPEVVSDLNSNMQKSDLMFKEFMTTVINEDLP